MNESIVLRKEDGRSGAIRFGDEPEGDALSSLIRGKNSFSSDQCLIIGRAVVARHFPPVTSLMAPDSLEDILFRDPYEELALFQPTAESDTTRSGPPANSRIHAGGQTFSKRRLVAIYSVQDFPTVSINAGTVSPINYHSERLRNVGGSVWCQILKP